MEMNCRIEEARLVNVRLRWNEGRSSAEKEHSKN